MKITFLGSGTSTGVPVLGADNEVSRSDDPKDTRLRSSVFIESGVRLIIDTGPDFRNQMLAHGIDTLDAVLYTHEHYDHAGGLDDLRPLSYKTPEGINVYLSEQTKDKIMITHDHIGQNSTYYGKPRLHFHTLPTDNQGLFTSFSIGDLSIQPVNMMHSRESNLDSVGFVFNRKFAYLTDFKNIYPPYLRYLENLDLLVLGAPLPFDHPTHISMEEAIRLIEQVKAKRGLITHLADKKLHSDLVKEMPKHIQPAYDSLALEI